MPPFLLQFLSMLEISAKMFFLTRFLFRLIGSRIRLDVIPLFLSQTDVILILLLSEKLTRNQKLFAAIANLLKLRLVDYVQYG